MTLIISKQSDFFANYEEILTKLNKNKQPEPLSEAEISQIKLAKNRTNTITTDLPESIKCILRIDKNFTINSRYYKEPLLKYFFERMDKNHIVHSARISDEIKYMFQGMN